LIKFIFKQDVGGVPKAILTSDGAGQKPEGADSNYDTRMATTIVDMINNVLSKGDVVNVKTGDPLKAEIARLYIEHLNSIGLPNIQSNVSVRHEGTEQAKRILDLFIIDKSVATNLSELEDADWYKQHLEVVGDEQANIREDDSSVHITGHTNRL